MRGMTMREPRYPPAIVSSSDRLAQPKRVFSGGKVQALANLFGSRDESGPAPANCPKLREAC